MKKIGILIFAFISVALFAQIFGDEIKLQQRAPFKDAETARDEAKLPTWISIGPKGGHIVSMTFNPKNSNEIFATTYGWPGCIYRTKNSGKKWERLAVLDAYLGAISVDPKDTKIIYVTGGSKIFKSEDGGESWEKYRFRESSSSENASDSEDFHVDEAIAINPQNPDILYGGGYFYSNNPYKSGMAVFKSKNGGKNWAITKLSPLSKHAYTYSVAINHKNPSVVFAGGYYYDNSYKYRVFKSTDGGKNWSDVTGIITGSPYAIVIDPKSTSRVFVGTNWSIYRSSNEGQSWMRNQSRAYGYDLAIDPSHPNTLYTGYIGSCYKSIDGGVTWTRYEQGLSGTCNALLVPSSNSSLVRLHDAKSNNVYYGSEAGFYKSSNGGISWKPSHGGMIATLIASLAVAPSSPNTLYAEVADVGLFKSTNSGKSWKMLPYFSRCGAISKIAVNPNDTKDLFVLAGG